MGKYVTALVIILVVVYAATSPDHAANVADNIGNFFVKVVHGLGRFFDKIA